MKMGKAQLAACDPPFLKPVHPPYEILASKIRVITTYSNTIAFSHSLIPSP